MPSPTATTAGRRRQRPASASCSAPRCRRCSRGTARSRTSLHWRACWATLGRAVATLRSMTIDAGVDVLTFGATKNGLMYGEAVVDLNGRFAQVGRYVRKQVTQLPSKMRFVAAQMNALLTDNLWIEQAA